MLARRNNKLLLHQEFVIEFIAVTDKKDWSLSVEEHGIAVSAFKGYAAPGAGDRAGDSFESDINLCGFSGCDVDFLACGFVTIVVDVNCVVAGAELESAAA